MGCIDARMVTGKNPALLFPSLLLPRNTRRPIVFIATSATFYDQRARQDTNSRNTEGNSLKAHKTVVLFLIVRSGSSHLPRFPNWRHYPKLATNQQVALIAPASLPSLDSEPDLGEGTKSVVNRENWSDQLSRRSICFLETARFWSTVR